MNSREISDYLLWQVGTAPIVPTQKVGASISPETQMKEDFFEALMALYLIQLHQLVLDAWNRFTQSQNEISQEKETNQRTHTRRVSEEEAQRLEGQRREMEAQSENFEGEVMRCGVHRQAGKFRYFEGQHLGEGRHLHLAI